MSAAAAVLASELPVKLPTANAAAVAPDKPPASIPLAKAIKLAPILRSVLTGPVDKLAPAVKAPTTFFLSIASRPAIVFLVVLINGVFCFTQLVVSPGVTLATLDVKLPLES